jgi:CRISPR-associated protein Cas2
MYVVGYDIPDDRIRLRVAVALSGFGTRVQKSVFECDIGPPELDDMIAALVRALEDPGNGDIRIYRLCGICQADAIGLGSATPEEGSDGVYLV